MNRNVRLSDALMPVCGSGVETQGEAFAGRAPGRRAGPSGCVVACRPIAGRRASGRARTCPMRRRGLRRPSAYFAESIRVLCGKYNPRLRKASARIPRGDARGVAFSGRRAQPPAPASAFRDRHEKNSPGKSVSFMEAFCRDCNVLRFSGALSRFRSCPISCRDGRFTNRPA